mmetsp:Transcript_9279/g.17481  ORF Transcript_9279/g.17481 Transcript_9279/m.17481 type:complete len:146 (-) Transcript_9279:54-491(-)
MTEAPQIQTILSSCYVSGREAESLISKFLLTQRKYLSSVDVDEVAPSNSDEEYFDMEDNNGGGTLEEIQSRLEGIVRSLSRRSPAEVEEAAVNIPVDESHPREDADATSGKRLKKETKKAKKSSRKKRKKEEDFLSKRKKMKQEE